MGGHGAGGVDPLAGARALLKELQRHFEGTPGAGGRGGVGGRDGEGGAARVREGGGRERLSSELARVLRVALRLSPEEHASDPPCAPAAVLSQGVVNPAPHTLDSHLKL